VSSLTGFLKEKNSFVGFKLSGCNICLKQLIAGRDQTENWPVTMTKILGTMEKHKESLWINSTLSKFKHFHMIFIYEKYNLNQKKLSVS